MTHPHPLPLSRPSAEVWAAARRDYLAGASAAVVAERHGLSERSLRRRAATEGLRRRAATEGWRRADVTSPPFKAPAFDIPALDIPPLDRPPGDTPLWGPDTDAVHEAMARRPELKALKVAEDAAALQLLFTADAGGLRRFAFRRATEAAVMGGPNEALAWARLLRLLERIGPTIDADHKPFRDVDLLRAQFLRMAARVEDRTRTRRRTRDPWPRPVSGAVWRGLARFGTVWPLNFAPHPARRAAALRPHGTGR